MLRDVEEVVREIMRDERFKCHQHLHFKVSLDNDTGESLFGGEANEGVSFQIGQIRCYPM